MIRNFRLYYARFQYSEMYAFDSCRRWQCLLSDKLLTLIETTDMGPFAVRQLMG